MESIAAAEAHLLRVEPRFGPLIKAHGPCELESHELTASVYETLMSVVFSQQLSVKAAATIQRRFVDLFACEGFPKPEQVLAKSVEDLRTVGCSRPKASYLLDIASKADTLPTMAELQTLPEEEIIARLTTIKGIGQWSVEMLLMFKLGRLDVLPVDDLGIQNGMMKFLGLDSKPKKKDMFVLAESWRPYRSVASWYLWRIVDPPQID